MTITKRLVNYFLIVFTALMLVSCFRLVKKDDVPVRILFLLYNSEKGSYQVIHDIPCKIDSSVPRVNRVIIIKSILYLIQGITISYDEKVTLICVYVIVWIRDEVKENNFES